MVSRTLDCLGSDVHQNYPIYLVVQKNEIRKYLKTWIRAYPNVQTLVLPKKIVTLSPTRQFIMEQAYERGIKKLVMMDDDLYFYIRKSSDDWHLRYAISADNLILFQMLEKWLDDYAHVAVSGREGNNRIKELSLEPARAMRVLGYDTEIFMKEKIRFDRIPTKQDFDVTLQLLRKGYPNKVSYEFANGQVETQTDGGCSVYRTLEMMNDSAEKLAKLHPGFVRVRTKELKGGRIRVQRDVTCYWKKALESSL